MRTIVAAIAMLVIALGVAPVRGAAAAGPLQRAVGEYEVTFGYSSEPAYMEEMTTIRVEVRDRATGSPVPGLENTLHVQGTVHVLDITKDFAVTLLAFEDRPGVYEGVFVPPKPGDYTYRLVGTIDSTPVDQMYVTGTGGLGPIMVRTTIDYGERGSIISTGILAAYGVGLAIMLAFMLRKRLRRRAHPA